MKARSVNNALAYEELLDALKARAYARAVRTIFAAPRTLYLLRFAVEARLVRVAFRLKCPRPLVQTHKQTICIISHQRIVGTNRRVSCDVLDLATALAAQHIDIHFLSPLPTAVDKRPFLTLRRETSVFKTYRVRAAWRIRNWIISKNPLHVLWAGIATFRNRPVGSENAPSSVSGSLTRKDQLFIAKYVPRTTDYLIADGLFLIDAFPYALCPNARTAVFVEDLMLRPTLHFRAQETIEGASTIDSDEIAKLGQADWVIAQRKEDAAFVTGRLPHQYVTSAPLVVRPVSAPQPGDSDIILLTTSNALSNSDALRRFIAASWPMIKRSRPQTQLWIVGKVSQALAEPPEGVKFFDTATDLTTLYGYAGVIVLPPQSGPGLKTTLLEALAHGKAVVATSAALEGVTELFADTVRTAEGPTELAGAVTSLLDNEALRVSLAVKTLYILFRHFNTTSCYEPVISLIRPSKTTNDAARELPRQTERATAAAWDTALCEAVHPVGGLQSPNDVGPSAVTVCICTFRRASIISTLHSVVGQILPADVSCRIIVVDNDFDRTAEPLIIDFRKTTEMPIEYVHAPGQNISTARNAGLNACKTRWLAFMDDDEIASLDWLGRLMARREDASAVFGPSEAVYNFACPKWVKKVDLHSNRVIWRHGAIETGYTSNVLIDLNFVRAHKLRFDERLGRTGGEDTMFFAAMRQSGGRLAYVSEAVAYERVPNARTTLNWVAKRRYRVGQVTSMMQQAYDPREYRLIPLLTPLKILYCAVAAALLAPRLGTAMWWLMRAVFHYGILSYRLTGQVREEYSFPSRGST